MKRQRGIEKKKLLKKSCHQRWVKVNVSSINAQTETRGCSAEQTLLKHYSYLSSSLSLRFSVCLSLIMISEHGSPGSSQQGQCVCIMQRHTLHGTQAGRILKCFCGDKTCAIDVFNFQPRGPKNILLSI